MIIHLRQRPLTHRYSSRAVPNRSTPNARLGSGQAEHNSRGHRVSVIVLIGFMGAGKTTVGRLLADALGVPFVDSDQHIEAQQQRTVQDIFATDGEDAFRQLESAAISELATGPDLVLAVGGGAAEHSRIRDAVADATVVYLQVEYAEALRRVSDDGLRPMLRRTALAEIYRRRLAAYAELATVTVDTDGLGPDEVIRKIQQELA